MFGQEKAYLPHKPSLRRRVSFELRKGTKTRPFLLALPNALMHSASANKDLHQLADAFVTMQNFITALEPISSLLLSNVWAKDWCMY